MIDLNLEAAEGLRRARESLKRVKGGFERAVSLSINRTLDSLKVKAARETASRYFISVGEVKKSFAVKKSNPGDMVASLMSRGRRRNLSDYKLTPKAPKLKSRDYIKGAVMRAGGLKSLPGAFLVKRGNGYQAVLRTGKGRYDLKGVVSPAVPQILKNEDTLNVLEQDAERVFISRLNHETLRILGALP